MGGAESSVVVEDLSETEIEAERERIEGSDGDGS